MGKKIVLVGKSCSGKSTIANILTEYNFNVQLSTTTRPKRPSEINGIDYDFIDKSTFLEMKSKNMFVETDEFVGWYYGLTHKEFNKADILILTPRGLKEVLQKYDRNNFIIIYIETSKKIRFSRACKRNDKDDSLHRRWVADDLDFSEIENWGGEWDIKISIQSEDSIKQLINLINSNYDKRKE